MNELKQSAIEYAKMGLAVFPLIPRDKRPLTANGFKDATTDVEKVEYWWNIHPDANIGIATGRPSGGIVVVDMDIDDDEDKDGYLSFTKWVNENYLILPETWLSITGRGGYHMIFKSSFPVKSRIGWLDAVDVRSDGGYIVAPPSIHPNGRRYEWEDAPEDLPIADSSDTDVEFLLNSINVVDKPVGEPLKVPDVIPKGHRDEMMFKLACKYQAMGMSDEEMEAALNVANQTRCQPPLSDKEIKQKIKQAQKYQKGESVTIEDNTDVVVKKTYKGKGNRKIEEEITEHDLDMPTLAEFEKRSKEWLISGYIPKGCVTLLCSDGGIGKTTIWCDTLAAFTTGRTTLFDKAIENPFRTGTCRNVMYFSKEDPTEEILKWKFEKAGGDQKRVRCFGIDDNRINKIWYGSLLLEQLIAKYKPDICVFDTLQAFLPDGVDMAKRKDMRDALNPLNQLGAQYGTAFLMIMHTNKSANSGRQRMADSSDIWDLGRSALMCGRTKDKEICYMSHEKCNYGRLQKTILFSVTDDGVVFKGTSKKKDADFIAQHQASNYGMSPKQEEAKEFILELVADSENKQIEINKLDAACKAAGISKHVVEDARASLVKDGILTRKSFGFGAEKKWYILLPIKKSGE